ncbi:PREDICTED: beta-defensin 123-like [Elephantulus edwardii]|uniref:beta-defensin 123-like n=1 Tax=Elephantulus edwardii TaxID=28737 RepID=UPI0003F0D64D|nr:PREDICTED: beta-defensin 123-like [Elephantulus edwardii]
MRFLLLIFTVLLLLSQLTSGYTQKCWNLHGNCRHKCFKKERVYAYCMNIKFCCVKPQYQPKQSGIFQKGLVYGTGDSIIFYGTGDNIIFLPEHNVLLCSCTSRKHASRRFRI